MKADEIYVFEEQVVLRREAKDLQNRLTNFNSRLEKAGVENDAVSTLISEGINGLQLAEKVLRTEVGKTRKELEKEEKTN